jgi:malate synthase
MTKVGGLTVDDGLYRFVAEELLPGTGLSPEAFWAAAEEIVHDLTPRNRELLARRDELQAQLDDYHREHPGRPADPAAYREFLTGIGYLRAEPDDFEIATTGADREITEQPGPQLVVPLLNARFATNAANARWGSLYDALYGTDVIPRDGELAPGREYNPKRGAVVIERGRALLDDCAPLTRGSHVDATSYTVDADGLAVGLKDGTVRLQDPGTVRRLPRGRRAARGDHAGAPRPAHRDRDRPHRPGRLDRPGRRPGHRAGGGRHHDHGPRGLGRRGRRGGQGPRLPQLARPHAGHARGRREQGRARPSSGP